MLDTRFAQSKPIVEVLAIKLNSTVPANARESTLGDQMAKRGRGAADILGRGSHIQQATFVALMRCFQTLADAVSNGVCQRIQTLIPCTLHSLLPKLRQ